MFLIGISDIVSVPISACRTRSRRPDRRLDRSNGPKIRSAEFCVCPHIWSRADYPMSKAALLWPHCLLPERQILTNWANLQS